MDQSTGQREALLLSPRQHVHGAVGVLSEVDQCQQVDRPGRDGGAVHPVCGAEEGEVLADGQLVVDPERVGHPTHLRPYAGRVGRRIRPGHPDLPRSGCSSEARISSRVVLPAPLGPTSAVT